jgi:uncharacterized membrane protein HdeD (DUF308 family)
MLELLTRNWWMLVLRGVAALLFGILAFTRPGITLGALVLLFGIYALVDGVLALVAVFSRHSGAPRWMLALEGIAGLAAAAAAFFVPGLTAMTLLYLIAGWAMITGILEIIAAIALRKQLTGEFWLILSGIASFLFGVLLVARPGAGALGCRLVDRRLRGRLRVLLADAGTTVARHARAPGGTGTAGARLTCEHHAAARRGAYS